MIIINYDFVDGSEVSYAEGVELKDNFTTNCLDFFSFDLQVDDVVVVDKLGGVISRNGLLTDNYYTSKEIRKEHNIQKILKSGGFNFKR